MLDYMVFNIIKGKMKLLLFGVVLLGCLTAGDASYPVRCTPVGESPLGVVDDCDVANDPFPFKWSVTLKVKKNLNWIGRDDVKIIYANPHETVE